MAPKRKRELEGVAEGWRELAKDRAPAILLDIAIETTWGLLGTVDSAHTTLGTVAKTLGIFTDRAARGVVVDAASACDRQFGGTLAASLLDDAVSELARLRALHNGVKFTFGICDVSMPLTVEGSHGHRRRRPPTGTWQVRRDALRHALDARRKLRSAAAIARAIDDAVRLFLAAPVGSPDWTTWTSAALKLAQHAAVSAALAMHALRRMRDAVALEFCDAWSALNA